MCLSAPLTPEDFQIEQHVSYSVALAAQRPLVEPTQRRRTCPAKIAFFSVTTLLGLSIALLFSDALMHCLVKLRQALLSRDVIAVALLVLLFLVVHAVQIRRRCKRSTRLLDLLTHSASTLACPIVHRESAAGQLRETQQQRTQRTCAKAKSAMRKNLHLRGLMQLHSVVHSLPAAESKNEDDSARGAARSYVETPSLHDFHFAVGAEVILPIEAAACQYDPDVSEHLRRLLEDRMAVLESGMGDDWLAAIPEEDF